MECALQVLVPRPLMSHRDPHLCLGRLCILSAPHAILVPLAERHPVQFGVAHGPMAYVGEPAEVACSHALHHAYAGSCSIPFHVCTQVGGQDLCLVASRGKATLPGRRMSLDNLNHGVVIGMMAGCCRRAGMQWVSLDNLNHGVVIGMVAGCCRRTGMQWVSPCIGCNVVGLVRHDPQTLVVWVAMGSCSVGAGKVRTAAYCTSAHRKY